MKLEEMQRRKKELGYSNEKLAELSGVPLGTVQKVMSGSTRSPRQKTLESLARVLAGPQPPVYRYMDEKIAYEQVPLRDPSVVYKAETGTHTIEDIYALPDGVRAELIDGVLYYMASPTRTHQKIAGEMYLAVAGYIRAHGGACEVYIPPYAVYLYGDDSVYVEPDLTVICDPSKSEERGCVGAPDWIKYRSAGVREYWIMNPDKRNVMVYSWLDGHEDVEIYSFEDEIPAGIYPDLKIRLADTV